MPTTRSQVGNERARVYEEPPASPSVSAPATAQPPLQVGTATEIRATAAAAKATSGSRAPSVRSCKSTASAIARAELEAEEQMAELQRKELQIQASLIKKRLAVDIATLREETDGDSICLEETETTEKKVTDWLQRARVQGEQTDTGHSESAPVERKSVDKPPPQTPNRVTFESSRRHRSPTPGRSRDRAIERLAEAFEKMTRDRPPTRQTAELPIFTGAPGEWLTFKAAMRESTSLHRFSQSENLARLRSCLRGEARETVSALLYTATDTSVIMKTLEQCFGRPEIIIDKALEEIKRLPRLGTTANELNAFAIKVQNIVTTITCIDEQGYILNPMLARQVTDKLTPHIKSKWCDYAEENHSRHEPELVLISRFLMKEADKAIRFSYSSNPHTTAAPTTKTAPTFPRRPNERARGAAVYATAEGKNECLCCGLVHETTKCRKLINMSLDQRWEWAKETKVCFLCLSDKHSRFKCKSKRCGIQECRAPHHALLHSPKKTETVVATDEVVTATTHTESKVLLKVCPIVIRGKDGREVETYAMFDEGSTVSLVDSELAEQIGAIGPTKALRIHGVSSVQSEPDSRVVDITIRGRAHREFHPIKARTVKSLCLGTQTVKSEILKMPHLANLDEQNVCYTNATPRVLIGSDNWHLIVTRRLLHGKKRDPAASLTHLGWVIHGTTPRKVIQSDTEQVLHIHAAPNEMRELNELVKSHFDIDALGISNKRKPIASEERAIEIFEQTATLKNGQYEVGLPWKSDNVTMPPSYDMAKRRLFAIERQMDRSPEFKTAYSKQVNSLLDKGYAELSTENQHSERTWYLPHFGVTNPNKPGKLRLVFDAAAKSNGVCLNDALLDGPDLLQNLNGVLFRFREKPIAVTADIREMFLQVKIRPEDRVAQHFLWRGENRDRPPNKYVMSSMIFGARSSPFLAHSVRNKNAHEHRHSYPLAYGAITRNTYMDDWLDSFDDMTEAEKTVREVQTVHKKAKFELAGWNSNVEALLSHIPSSDKSLAPKALGANATAYEKTLGMLWLAGTDELAFNTAMHRVPEDVKNNSRIPTKREALGMVMSLFDPLGLLSPFTVTAKIILQEIWRKKIGWDDPLPYEDACAFSEWQNDLKTISNLRVPRCYIKNEIECTHLHIFTDASEQAYAAVAYWRIVYANGAVGVSLVAGKAKVAPIKTQSIPRMELQAALVGARLATEILKEHRYSAEVTLWSDSKTVLHWIRNDSARYTPYVSHRLCEIGELTRAEQWRWVPTSQNVADDATRIGNTKLTANDRWFSGPEFLKKPESYWPREAPEGVTDDVETVMCAHVRSEPFVEFERFSSYDRLLRAMTCVVFFIEKCRKRASRIEPRHIERAEHILITESQKDSFPTERSVLARGESVGRASRLSKLDPVYRDGMLCLNGRINAANVPEEARSPPILDGAHPLSRLLIRKEHEQNHHAGREHVVNNIRTRFWILGLRPTVKSMIAKCLLCTLRRRHPLVPVKGNLPRERLDAYSRPFSRCGLDAFGPMWVVIGRRREKRWGLIFTCMVTRAVHLELLNSLSTDSAIMAIRRMSARRGFPQTLMSDNGTNFHGADVELAKAYKEWLPELEKYAVHRKIEWKYINPGAPNEGGAWERLIRSVKVALGIILNEKAPKEEVLATLLTEVEHTLNSRPLTHVSVEPNDQEALTPNHFLLGSALGVPHTGKCDLGDRKTWRAAQALADAFWSRWTREYLPTLTPRGDVRKSQRNLQIGDVVIIVDGLLPRNVWPRGQVEKIHLGPDNVVRSADVRTRGGVFRRPVRRLVVLPNEEGLEALRQGESVTDDPK